MNTKALEKILKVSEEFFGTQTDPDQIVISTESANKLFSIHPDTILYKFNGEDPIAWSTIVPTSVDTMNKFVSKEISERELLEIAVKEKKFEALYLCGIFVLPEFRGKGFGKELSLKGISILSFGKKVPLYAWTLSNEGEDLIKLVSKELDTEIINRV